MPTPSQPLPTVGQPNSTEDAKVRDALSELQSILTGNVDSSNIADAAVTTSEIANGTIATGDLATATLNHWLKLASVADRKVAFGSGSSPAFGGTNSVTQSQAHGLGVTPVFAVVVAATMDTFSNTAVPVIAAVTGLTSTNVNMKFRTGDGASSNNAVVYYWLAIG